ncbi:MAG: DJ-1/PfpI family protein [Methanomassiliicoccus sp.]|nr:DJ-1/PfpI family protein [Methanomassiliicoccus sp.]
MRVGMLVYDGCVQFEVVLAAYFVQQRGEIMTYGLEMRDVRSAEGFQLRPDHLLSELDPEAIDAFIIPGGQPAGILDDPILAEKLRAMNAVGKLLAAICAAPIHLSRAGVLEGRKFTSSVYLEREGDFTTGTYTDEDLVQDGNTVTAWPNAYVDFAMALADRLHLFVDENDRDETVRVFREFKRG